jgi:hypothetical protein
LLKKREAGLNWKCLHGLVKFVQVTGGRTHSFDLNYFRSFLTALKNSHQSFGIKSLKILFLVHQKKRLIFKLGEPSKLGLSENHEWEYGKVTGQVDVVFIKGWNIA